jgi:hypothetical protein
MAFRPVFQSKFEVNVWKRLDAGSVPQSKRDELYADLAGNVLKHEGLISSAILVKIIQKLHETNNSNLLVLLPQLVSKSRSNDCNPALTAALVYLDIGDVAEAKSMVESVKHGQDIAFLGCVKAKILIKEGETGKAKKELMKARCSNPAYPLFYEIMQQTEPDEGWMYRRNIELLVSGSDPIPCGESGRTSPAESLYHIYHEWYRGDKEEATRSLISSEEYKNKNP